jgi:hypothetical protein
MALQHACFISFPRGLGKDSQFADHFFNEFKEHLAVLDKNLSVFKYDRCEDRRKGDAWDLWIQRELCDSAMMIAICAPNYFNGSAGCISEFKGMEALIAKRTNALGGLACEDWLIGLRLKDTFAMPALNPYPVRDFLDCCASPEKVRRMHKYRRIVEELADKVYKHWRWLHDNGLHSQLAAANICATFTLPKVGLESPDPFPHAGGVN